MDVEKEYFENGFVRIQILNGVVFIEYKKEEHVTLEVVQTAVKERLRLAKGKTLPIFIDFRNPKGGTKEARTYLSSEEGIKGLSAGAMLINSSIGMVAFNFYMKFDTPSLPMKVFVDKNKALKWLEQFKSENLN